MIFLPPIIKKRLKDSRPMQPSSELVRGTTGTRLVKVQPVTDGASGVQSAEIDGPGAGLVIINGVAGYGAVPLTGTYKPLITFLAPNEKLPKTGTLDVQGDETMSPISDRTFFGPEIYDGALLPGFFDRVRFTWGLASSAIARPMHVRVLEPAYGKIVYVKSSGPPVGSSAVIDWFNRLETTIGVTPITIYDDANPMSSVVDDGQGAPAVDTGFGADTNFLEYHARGVGIKRRLLAWFSCDQAFNVAVGVEHSGANFRVINMFASRTTMFDGDTQHVVDLSHSAGGTASQGLVLPGCRLRIDVETQAAGPATLHTTLSFMAS